jgi:hypothetical protein
LDSPLDVSWEHPVGTNTTPLIRNIGCPPEPEFVNL